MTTDDELDTLGAPTFALPAGVARCPTCGRWVSPDDGYYDTDPAAPHLVTPYCDARCAPTTSED